MSVCGTENRHQVKMKIKGAIEPLTITCSSIEMCEELASIVDGYSQLFTNLPSSIWFHKGIFVQIIIHKTVGVENCFFLFFTKQYSVIMHTDIVNYFTRQ